MEVGQIVIVCVALTISIILVYIVWIFFCKNAGKSRTANEDDSSAESDSLSSVNVISSRRRKWRKRRTTSNSVTATTSNDETDEDISPPKKPYKTQNPESQRKSIPYQFSENSYGLHDPFGEWAPKDKQTKETESPTITRNFPKSPKTRRQTHKSHEAMQV